MLEVIANRLKLVRNALDMNAEDVAHEINYSANLIWQIERAASKPNIDFIVRICKVYNLSIDVLVYSTDKEFQEILNDIYKKCGAD